MLKLKLTKMIEFFKWILMQEKLEPLHPLAKAKPSFFGWLFSRERLDTSEPIRSISKPSFFSWLLSREELDIRKDKMIKEKK